MSGKEKLPVMTATCCRDWPVVPGYSIRKCGLCGKTPVINEKRAWEGQDVELREAE